MTDYEDDSVCIDHEPCPKCGSSDNLARYDDGHAYCFSMGCDHREPADGEERRAPVKAKSGDLLRGWEPATLSKRMLTTETTSRWRYGIAEFSGKKVQVANYVRDGAIVAQKVRFANKDFLTLGDFSNAGLYGQHMYNGGKRLVIVEGEIDAMSMSQLFDHKWPVVSVPTGAKGAAKAVTKELEWVLGFDEIILMLDNDEAGRMATQEILEVLPPARGLVASFDLKDVNAMLVAGRSDEVIRAFWDAKVYRPDGIVSIGDIKEAAMKPVEEGMPWPWPGLTRETHGRRDGELYALGAGTGVGKTDWFTQLIVHDAVELNVKCGVLYLEQPPVETVRRLAGKLAGKKFHIPGENWTVEELGETIDKLDALDNIELYNHFGTMDWATIESRIRYMVTALGCRHIFLDHLTALAAHSTDERKEIESLMADMSSLAQELMFKFHFISHLATPEGKPHEEGGRVMVRHFKGSRSIGFWSHFMIGLERNQQAEDMVIRTTTVMRVLKDRYTGLATGWTTGLCYDLTTGIYNECPVPNQKEDSKGFKNEPTTQEDF